MGDLSKDMNRHFEHYARNFGGIGQGMLSFSLQNLSNSRNWKLDLV